MLKIFKSHALKTSLLDDFMYDEKRQKIMQDEKAKLFIRSVESPLFIQPLEAPRKLIVGQPPSKYEKNFKIKDDSDNLNQTSISSSEQNIHNSHVTSSKSVNEQAEKIAVHEDIPSILKIGSVTITPKQVETKQSGYCPNYLLFYCHILILTELAFGLMFSTNMNFYCCVVVVSTS